MKNQILNRKINILIWAITALLLSSGVGYGQTFGLRSKKGACITTKKNNLNSWQEKVELLNVSWHYNWSSKINAEEPRGVEFVPMVFGYWGVNDGFRKAITDLAQAKVDRKHKHLMGFNEPDQKSQSNMSVEKALLSWKYLERTGLRLGSPGPVHADKPWMVEFMKKAEERNLRIDFVCVHWYGGANADSLISYLKRIHKLYNKPIWITEFAAADWEAKTVERNRHKPEKVYQFMKEALPRLDKLEFVERYAWFSAGTKKPQLGTSSLFENDGSLTRLGKLYAAHGQPQ